MSFNKENKMTESYSLILIKSENIELKIFIEPYSLKYINFPFKK